MSLTLATIQIGKGKAEKVQFNPSSLRVTTTNQFDDKHANQVAKPTSFKLDVELLFDSTEDGRDVYEKTRSIRFAAMATAKGATKTTVQTACGTKVISKPNPSLSLVTFTWGTTIYKGYIESLNETLDYWSSDGVPLRSTLQISIKGTTENFLTGTYGKVSNYSSNPVPALPEVVLTSAAQEGKHDLLKPGLAAPADNGPSAGSSTGRGIAAMNGLESMRGGVGAVAGAGAGFSAGAGFAAGASAGAGFAAGGSAGFGASAGAGLAVGAGAQLQAAAGFAMSGGISAGASVGFGIGASAGLSAGAGLGASVGVGMAAGAGIGVGGGISAGAGIGVSAGAGIGMSAGAGIGMSAGLGGGGIGISTSTSVTGLDGVTTTTSSSTMTGLDGVTHSNSMTTQTSGGMGMGGVGFGMGSASAGMTASGGAFAGLGMSRTTMPPASFNPDTLLPPPLAAGAGASFDVSGRLVGSEQQVAASYSHTSVTTW